MAKSRVRSSDFLNAARAERDLLAARRANAQARVEHFEALATEVRDEAQSLATSIRSRR